MPLKNTQQQILHAYSKQINVYHVVKEENKETKEGQWPKHPKNSLITTIIKQKSQTINLPMGSNLEMSLEFILLIVIKIYFKDW